MSLWSSLFHRSTTRSEKKYFRMSRLLRCLTIFHEWPLVLCWLSNVKKASNETAEKPLFILNTSNRSARFLLSSNDQIPRAFSRSSYSIDFNPGSSLVNRCWTLSNNCLSFFVVWRPCRCAVFKVWSSIQFQFQFLCVVAGQVSPVLAQWTLRSVSVLRCWSNGRVQHAAVHSTRV